MTDAELVQRCITRDGLTVQRFASMCGLWKRTVELVLDDRALLTREQRERVEAVWRREKHPAWYDVQDLILYYFWPPNVVAEMIDCSPTQLSGVRYGDLWPNERIIHNLRIAAAYARAGGEPHDKTAWLTFQEIHFQAGGIIPRQRRAARKRICAHDGDATSQEMRR